MHSLSVDDSLSRVLSYRSVVKLENELHSVPDWAAEQAGSSNNKCSGYALFESPPGHRLFDGGGSLCSAVPTRTFRNGTLN